MFELRDVTKTYKMGDVLVHALRGISITISDGEFVAIMGPSGSGKSTLMHILGCLDRPTTGTFRLDGQDVQSLSDNKLAEIRNRKIGFVFQQFNLLPRTTLLENVETPLIYAGVPPRQRRRLATEALERVGLGDRVKHHPNEVSGGEKQRAAIARALVTRPAIILADEPTGNLDTRTGNEIMQLITGLHNEGHTIVLVTHEPDIAEYARRVIFIRDGVVIDDTGRQGGDGHAAERSR